eukprot:6212153-Pleurochrysis_carterae.AAC.1
MAEKFAEKRIPPTAGCSFSLVEIVGNFKTVKIPFDGAVGKLAEARYVSVVDGLPGSAGVEVKARRGECQSAARRYGLAAKIEDNDFCGV